MIETRVRRWDVEVARFRLDKSFDEDKSEIRKGGAPVGTPFFLKPALNLITSMPLSAIRAVSARAVSMA